MNNAVTFTKQTSITLEIDGCEPITGLVEGQTWNGMTEYRNSQGVVVLCQQESYLSRELSKAMNKFTSLPDEPEKATLVSITPGLLTPGKLP